MVETAEVPGAAGGGADPSVEKGWAANQKRTFDEFLKASLMDVDRNQVYFSYLNAVSLQAVQNAVENANWLAKQALRHEGLAAAQQWNPIVQGAGETMLARTMTLDDASIKAIGVALAAAVIQALAAQPAPAKTA